MLVPRRRHHLLFTVSKVFLKKSSHTSWYCPLEICSSDSKKLAIFMVVSELFEWTQIRPFIPTVDSNLYFLPKVAITLDSGFKRRLQM